MLHSWSREARLLSEAALLAAGLGILAILSSHISRDLRALAAAALALGQGTPARSPPAGREDEIGDLARTLDAMGKRLRETIRDVTEERTAWRRSEAMGDGVLVTDGREGRPREPCPARDDRSPPTPSGTVRSWCATRILHDLVMADWAAERISPARSPCAGAPRSAACSCAWSGWRSRGGRAAWSPCSTT
jgi:HAMP domain-containing protein